MATEIVATKDNLIEDAFYQLDAALDAWRDHFDIDDIEKKCGGTAHYSVVGERLREAQSGTEMTEQSKRERAVPVPLTSQQCAAIEFWLEAMRCDPRLVAKFRKMARRGGVHGAAHRPIPRSIAREVVSRLTPRSGPMAGYLAAIAKTYGDPSYAPAALDGVCEIDAALKRKQGRPKIHGHTLAIAAARSYAFGDDGGMQQRKLREYRIRLRWDRARSGEITILKAISELHE